MTNLNPALSQSHRIPELDGLRGIAVIMVLAWHFVGVMVNPAAGAWSFAAYNTLRLGRTGVDLFFVLSGFLITGIVLDRTRSMTHFLACFYARRSLRILPPYLALVGAFWLLIAMGMDNRGVNDQIPLWRHLTFTQNWWMAEHSTLGPEAMAATWYVAIEEQYYIVAPLILMTIPRSWLAPFMLLTAVSSALFRALIYAGPDTGISAYILTPSRLDGLAIGGLLAWMWRDAAGRAWLQAHAGALTQVTALALLGMVALGALMARDIAWHMFMWGHSYLALLSMLIIACTVLKTGSASLRHLRDARLRFIGTISYSLYLFHPCIFGAMILLLGRKPVINSLGDWMLVLGALVFSILVCATSLRLVEGPLTAFGRRLRY